MGRSMRSRQIPGQQRQGWSALRVLLAACGSAAIGLMLNGVTLALADEDIVVRGDRLIFIYQVYNDATVDAAWGAGTNPRTVPENELVAVTVLVPPHIAARLKEAEEANYSDDVTGGLLEVLVFIGGSASGTRCHYVSGEKHCHTC
jgi:hypothetical protein